MKIKRNIVIMVEMEQPIPQWKNRIAYGEIIWAAGLAKGLLMIFL